MQPKIRSLVLLALAVFAIHGAQAQQPAVPKLRGYRIILRSSSAPYQISTPDEPKRKNWFVDPDADDKASRTFGEAQRFEAKSFVKKRYRIQRQASWMCPSSSWWITRRSGSSPW